MKKSIFLFALLFSVIPASLFAAKVDTVWTSSSYGDGLRFQHPITKNLVIERSDRLMELDSKNGEFVRNLFFPFVNDDVNNQSYISPDGTKLLRTVVNHTYIYDYPSLDLIYRLDSCIYSKIINNDEVIGRHLLNRLVKYNLKTKERQEVIPEGSVQDIATSWDGRFIAYSTNPIYNKESTPARLILMDAKTMKEITVIDEVKYNEHQFGGFNFSKDGKYIVFDGKVTDGKQYLKIFDVDIRKIAKVYDANEYNFTSGYVRFLNERLYIFYRQNSVDKVILTQLIDINTGKSIFTMNDGVTRPILNNELNHLYYYNAKNYYCLNLTDIITGVSSSQDSGVVQYNNKQLIINKENVKRVEVSDISGRLIISKAIDNPFSDNVILSVNLLTGSYLVKVSTGSEVFTRKLLIGE